jgi:hypothetical protein
MATAGFLEEERLTPWETAAQMGPAEVDGRLWSGAASEGTLPCP